MARVTQWSRFALSILCGVCILFKLRFARVMGAFWQRASRFRTTTIEGSEAEACSWVGKQPKVRFNLDFQLYGVFYFGF